MARAPEPEVCVSDVDFDVASARPKGTESVELEIEYGRAVLTQKQLAEIDSGDLLVLEQHAADPVDIRLGGRLVARGELVVIDGKIGVRLSEVSDS